MADAKFAMTALHANVSSTAPRQQLLDLLQGLAAESRACEDASQRDPRQPVHCPVTVAIESDGGHTRLVEAWATELSSGGACLLTDAPLPDATLWVDLQALSDRPLVLPARLIYRMQLLPHTYRHGLAFV